jgi:hypothetical protein
VANCCETILEASQVVKVLLFGQESKLKALCEEVEGVARPLSLGVAVQPSPQCRHRRFILQITTSNAASKSAHRASKKKKIEQHPLTNACFEGLLLVDGRIKTRSASSSTGSTNEDVAPLALRSMMFGFFGE